MPNKFISMHALRRMLLLIQRDFSDRNIAIELNLSRVTVGQYHQRIRSTSRNCEELLALSDAQLTGLLQQEIEKKADPRLDDFMLRRDYFLEELNNRGVTKKLLLAEYRKVYPDCYGYTRFCELLDEAKAISQASMHQEHVAGDVLQIDFAGDKISYLDKVLGEVACIVFVAVLPYSGYTFVMALLDATVPQLVKALNACLRYFGGVPMQTKCDNMKQAVIKASRYEPTFNELLEQWSIHNGTALITARVQKPKDKPHVEGGVKLSYQRIYAPLRNETFGSIEELNEAIRLQVERHNHTPLQRKRYSRFERFMDMEKGTLSPLPSEPFIVKKRSERAVEHNYHFLLSEDNHYYSVPYSYIGKKLTAVYDTDTVEVYLGQERIVTYNRNPRPHAYTTLPEHMPPAHLAYQEQKGWDSAYFLTQAAKIGPATHGYMQGILKSRPVEQHSFNGCRGLLREAIKKNIGYARMEAACKRGLLASVFNYKTICNILEKRLDEQPLPGIGGGDPLPPHDNLRGPESFK
jgi:transposase